MVGESLYLEGKMGDRRRKRGADSCRHDVRRVHLSNYFPFLRERLSRAVDLVSTTKGV